MSATSISNFWDTSWGYLLQAIFMNVAFVITFVWYYTRRNKQPVLRKPNKSTLKYVGWCVLFGIATLFLLSGILNYFQLFLDKIGYKAPTVSFAIDTPTNYIVSLISMAIIPAVCEELIFRGVITTALKPKGQIFAVVLSSAMFAMFHFSPSQLIYPLCFGLILGIVYLRTNNILFPILLHFINNALSISIQYFSSSSGEAFTHSTSILLYSLFTLTAWICVMYYLFKDFKNHLAKQHNTDTANSNNQNIEPAHSVQTTTETQENESANTKVLYGSLVLMAVVYVLMLFV